MSLSLTNEKTRFQAFNSVAIEPEQVAVEDDHCFVGFDAY